MLKKPLTYLPHLVAIVAISVICGWFAGSRSLIQIFPGFAPMQFNTALCFLLISAALIASHPGLRSILASLCLCFVSLTLLEYLLEINLYIDNLFLEPYLQDRTSHPGRMSEMTALSFVMLTATALIHQRDHTNPKHMLFGRMLLLLTFAISFTSIAAYLFSPETVFIPAELRGMALHTALAHFLLGSFLLYESMNKYSNLTEHRQTWSSFICLIAGTLLSIGLWCLAVEYESDVIKNDLHLDATLRSLAIQNQFDEDRAKLETVERFFAASSFVSAEEFEIFVSPFFVDSDSMLAVDWSPQVASAQVPEFLKSSKLPFLKQLSPDIATTPHQGADVYFPILYTSPKRFAQVARGFDHYADPPRFRAMNLAAQKQKTAGTEPIPLFRSPESDKMGWGMLVVTPVFDTSSEPSDTKGIKPDIKGFVIGLFRFDGILQHTLAAWEMRGLTYELFGRTDAGDYISVFRPKDDPAYQERGTQKSVLQTGNIPLTFGDRKFKIQFTALPFYLRAKLSAFPTTLLLAAFSLTLITACYLLYLSKQQLRIEELLKQNNIALLELEEREQLFKQLAETAPIGIFRTDADGACLYVNPAWLEMTSLGNQEALRFGWADAIHPQDKARVEENWNKAVASSEQFSLRFRFLRKDGSTRWVVAEAAPVTREDGELVGYVGSNFDFTELHKALEVKNEFLANMSHEIRTPMNSILGFTKRLLKKESNNLSERSVDALDTIDRNAEHLLSIINDILDLTKLESGNVTLERSEFNFARLISDSIEALKPLAEEKQLKLALEDLSNGVEVYADRKKLSQVISNLLSNAIKYTDRGAIRVVLRLENNALIVDVIDTGIGIKPEERGKLFQKFSQLEGASHRREGGTGLGLCLVREYVELHGGIAEVESEWGIGSTFRIHLPLPSKTSAEPVTSAPTHSPDNGMETMI